MVRVWRHLEPTTWVAQPISELPRTAKWHDPPEEVREEDDLLTGEELKVFQSVAARFNFLVMDRPDLLYSVKELLRKVASPSTQDITALKRVARYTIKYPRMTCRYQWTLLNNNTEVFGDANFAGRHTTRKSKAGGVAMWSGQFVKAWSRSVGVLVLSSGESELAAVVRAATEGMGLQSILNDFCLCGHVAIRSDATAAIGMVHQLGMGKSDIWLLETVGCNTMLVQGKFECPKCQGWTIRAMHKPRISGRNHCCATRKRANGSLSLVMTNRDECRWVVLRQGVGQQELVQNTTMHGQKWSRES